MATDIVDQVVDMVKVASSFALHLDESTDISGQAQLVAFMRYRDTDDVCEHVLFCKILMGKTTGEDIFNVVDSFFRDRGISWSSCTNVCTDGAAAMTSRVRGLMAHVRKQNHTASYIGKLWPPKE